MYFIIKPKLAQDGRGSGTTPPGDQTPLQVFGVDFSEQRLCPFAIVILRVTWLGHAGEPPNRIVTVWLRAYVYERTVLTKIMVQLDSESLISRTEDPYLNRWLEQCLPELCLIVRERLADL